MLIFCPLCRLFACDSRDVSGAQAESSAMDLDTDLQVGVRAALTVFSVVCFLCMLFLQWSNGLMCRPLLIIIIMKHETSFILFAFNAYFPF